MKYDQQSDLNLPVKGNSKLGESSLRGFSVTRGRCFFKIVTVNGPIALYAVDEHGQLALCAADDNVIEWEHQAGDLAVEFLLQGPKDCHCVVSSRVFGAGQEQDNVPAQPIVDEYEEESVEAKVLKALRKFIPDQVQADMAFNQIGDILDADDEENFGPDGDSDVDLDLVFLEQGPAALVQEFEKRNPKSGTIPVKGIGYPEDAEDREKPAEDPKEDPARS